MSEKRFTKGDWTNCRYDICEILDDGDLFCTVATEDVDVVIGVLEENEQLKQKYNNSVILSARIQTKNDRLKDENEQLKERIKELEKDSFLCLDCEYCRNVEIGCLCNHNDDWVEFVTECDDFKKELYE